MKRNRLVFQPYIQNAMGAASASDPSLNYLIGANNSYYNQILTTENSASEGQISFLEAYGVSAPVAEIMQANPDLVLTDAQAQYANPPVQASPVLVTTAPTVTTGTITPAPITLTPVAVVAPVSPITEVSAGVPITLDEPAPLQTNALTSVAFLQANGVYIALGIAGVVLAAILFYHSKKSASSPEVQKTEPEITEAVA